jgi:N-acyl-D-amino-acid deacylase
MQTKHRYLKNCLLAALLFPLIIACQPKVNIADILIRNGKIIDGTGNSWYYGDVAIIDSKIIAIGNVGNLTATKTIDASGLIVAPGFIDVHTHLEGDEAKTPTADNFIYDGVTSVITGNCGLSESDIAVYFKFIDSLKLSINVGALVGHNDVRKAVMGRASRLPTEAELQQMEAIVDKAMKDGAMGLSTGLIYIPGTYSQTSEVLRLAKVASRYKGLYATHMRNEGDSVTQAIAEALHIGKAAGMPVEISHFKLGGQNNWGRSDQTLGMIKQARMDGIEVTIDQYPYTASSTSLSTLVPDRFLADGQDSIAARLQKPAIRKQAVQEMLQSLHKRKLKHFSYAVVAYFSADTTLNGKSVEKINLIRGKKHNEKEEANTILDMMVQGGASAVFHGMSEADVQNIMRYPFNMFASDATIRQFKVGMPHPRGYGTNARVLGHYVRELKTIGLEEAIRRMTSLPAQKFNLKDRGLLKTGMAADLIVFDEKTVIDKSTFDNPHQFSQGFQTIIVNGKIVVENGKHNGIRNGMVLRGPGYVSN